MMPKGKIVRRHMDKWLMYYLALQTIQTYKPGSRVPDEAAGLWMIIMKLETQHDRALNAIRFLERVGCIEKYKNKFGHERYTLTKKGQQVVYKFDSLNEILPMSVLRDVFRHKKIALPA